MSQAAIRTALRQAPDGLTVGAIAEQTGKDYANVYHAIKGMPDVYVDRWTGAPKSPRKYIPVYAAVEVPENAPKPD